MPPSTSRFYLVGKLGSYEVPTLDRVDSCLRELRHRLNAAGPQMLPRIWADVDMLLERRSQLTTGKSARPASTPPTADQTPPG